MKKKSKHKPSCPLCTCPPNHSLSPKAAAQVLAFLEALTENFMAKYDVAVCRHYAQRDKARRKFNGTHIGTSDESWRDDSNAELF